MSVSVIMQYLCNSQFQTAIGARGFDYVQNGVAFHFPHKGINAVRIIPVDGSYTMVFLHDSQEVTSATKIRPEQLRATFSRHTGIRC